MQREMGTLRYVASAQNLENDECKAFDLSIAHVSCFLFQLSVLAMGKPLFCQSGLCIDSPGKLSLVRNLTFFRFLFLEPFIQITS